MFDIFVSFLFLSLLHGLSFAFEFVAGYLRICSTGVVTIVCVVAVGGGVALGWGWMECVHGALCAEVLFRMWEFLAILDFL